MIAVEQVTDNNSLDLDLVGPSPYVELGINNTVYQKDVTIASISTASITPLNTWNVNPIKGNQSTINYQINPVAGATNYNWSFPLGWTVVGGANTTSIWVQPSLDNVNGGYITVSASNTTYGCTNLTTNQYSQAIIRPFGTSLGTITGPAGICSYKSTKYSVALNPYVTNYNWTVPAGWIINGQGTNTIYITAPSSTYVGGGEISVTGSAGSQSTIASTLIIGIGIPTVSASYITYAGSILRKWTISHPIGSTLYSSTDNITWAPANSIYNVLYPDVINKYFKATNECGSSPVQLIHMTGTNCPTCPQ